LVGEAKPKLRKDVGKVLYIVASPLATLDEGRRSVRRVAAFPVPALGYPPFG
jgi:hypothetical protein